MPEQRFKNPSDILDFAISKSEEVARQNEEQIKSVTQEIDKYKKQLEEILSSVGSREPMPQMTEKYDFHERLPKAVRNAIVPLAVMIAAYNRPKFAEALTNVSREYEREMQSDYERKLQQWAMRDKNVSEDLQTKSRIVSDLLGTSSDELNRLRSIDPTRWISAYSPAYGAMMEKLNAEEARAFQAKMQDKQNKIEFAKLFARDGGAAEQPDDVIRFIGLASSQLNQVLIDAANATGAEKEKLMTYASILQKQIDQAMLRLRAMTGYGDVGSQIQAGGTERSETSVPEFLVEGAASGVVTKAGGQRVEGRKKTSSDRQLLSRLK